VFAAAVKDVHFVFDIGVLPDLVILCCGAVIAGDRLLNMVPSDTQTEPSFIVDSIDGAAMKAYSVHGERSGVFKFRCLDKEEWNERQEQETVPLPKKRDT